MAYNNYGCLLRRLEKHKGAKEMFAKALSIDPKFIMAARNLERANNKEQNTQNRTQNIVTNKKNVNINSNKLDDGGCKVM